MSIRLSLSNLAFSSDKLEIILKLLKKYKFEGVEVAPTKFWGPWEKIDLSLVQEFSLKLKSQNLVVSAMQSLMFGRSDLSIFGDNKSFEKVMEHFEKSVLPIAKILDVRTLVFGSPKNRIMPDAETEKNYRIACGRFFELSNLCEKFDSKFCIEPNPEYYNCNFITNIKDAVQLISDVNHSNFGLNFDYGCTTLAKGNPLEMIKLYHKYIDHFHISTPDLKTISTLDSELPKVMKLLSELKYSNWISIEMLESDLLEVENCLKLFSLYEN